MNILKRWNKSIIVEDLLEKTKRLKKIIKYKIEVYNNKLFFVILNLIYHWIYLSCNFSLISILIMQYSYNWLIKNNK